MAEKLLATDDPYTIVAQQAPVPPGTDPDRAMARVFIEEYALLGFTPAKILLLFQSAHFEGTRRILEARGEDFVRRLIDEVFEVAPGAEASAAADTSLEGLSAPARSTATGISTPRTSGGK